MMKKLISLLTALCLLCAAAAALAEEAAPKWEDMPLVVSTEEGIELTEADFAGDWTVDKVFVGTEYLTPEEAAANGLTIRNIRIGDGKVVNLVPDEGKENEAPEEYTLESNQLWFKDGEGLEAVIEKLTDGNIVLTVFIPREDGTNINVSFFMVPVTPEA